MAPWSTSEPAPLNMLDAIGTFNVRCWQPFRIWALLLASFLKEMEQGWWHRRICPRVHPEPLVLPCSPAWQFRSLFYVLGRGFQLHNHDQTQPSTGWNGGMVGVVVMVALQHQFVLKRASGAGHLNRHPGCMKPVGWARCSEPAFGGTFWTTFSWCPAERWPPTQPATTLHIGKEGGVAIQALRRLHKFIQILQVSLERTCSWGPWAFQSLSTS